MEPYNPEQALLNVRREFGEHGGVAPSISRSSTFTVMEPGTLPEIFQGIKTHDKNGCFLYSRHFNPTVNVLARYLAALEGTEGAVCTASGMAAISCALMQMCRSGDHIVASDTIYGGTHAFLKDLLSRYDIQTTFVNIADHAAVAAAITDQTRAIFTESMENPTLKIADIPYLADLAHSKNITLVIDNTFAPMILSPARLGADIVIHSLTKFINGASDIIAGVICGRNDFLGQLVDLHTGCAMLLGPAMDARMAFDVIQRLPHLPIRMREHGHRAQAIASMLDEMGVAVTYPGLPSHPQHDLLKSIRNPGYGFGGILTIDCQTREKADTLMEILQNEEKFGLIAVSLGYFDTLMTCSSASTSSEISETEQRKIGLSPGLMRLSVGYTGSLDERLQQIKRAVALIGLV